MLEETQDIKKISEACWQKPKELFQKKVKFSLSQISLFPVVISVESTSGVFPTNKTPVKVYHVYCHIIVIALLFFLLAIAKQAIKLSKQDQVCESLSVSVASVIHTLWYEES